MNFKIDMKKIDDGLELAQDTMMKADGRASFDYTAGRDAKVILMVLKLLEESGVLKITEVRETKKKKK